MLSSDAVVPDRWSPYPNGCNSNGKSRHLCPGDTSPCSFGQIDGSSQGERQGRASSHHSACPERHLHFSPSRAHLDHWIFPPDQRYWTGSVFRNSKASFHLSNVIMKELNNTAVGKRFSKMFSKSIQKYFGMVNAMVTFHHFGLHNFNFKPWTVKPALQLRFVQWMCYTNKTLKVIWLGMLNCQVQNASSVLNINVPTLRKLDCTCKGSSQQ